MGLVYNGWNWYVRLAHPQTHLEGIASRPLLLAAVGRLTQHAGQSRLLLTITHAASDQVKTMSANIRAGLEYVKSTAPQLAQPTRWKVRVRFIVDKILAVKRKNHPNKPPAFQLIPTIATG